MKLTKHTVTGAGLGKKKPRVLHLRRRTDIKYLDISRLRVHRGRLKPGPEVPRMFPEAGKENNNMLRYSKSSDLG